jgi:HAD superfamily hydrolase (TIGR01490 family)
MARLHRRGGPRPPAGAGEAVTGKHVGSTAHEVSDPSAVLAGAASAAAASLTPPGPPVPAEPPEPDWTAAAFVDVDNTLMRGASIFWFARGLAARGFFTTRDLARFLAKQARFQLLGTELDAEGLAEMRASGLSFVAGKSVEEIVAYGEEIWDELMAERVYQGTLKLVRRHLDAGQRVYLVTATPIELAQIIARRLGFTGALGTVSEVVDGLYTGRLVGEPLHGPAKAEAVKALALREGLDLSRCAAYSDSSNDIPMLACVGRPCAVNPDPDLRKAARANGWRMVDVRTGRKVAKVGVSTTAGTLTLAGAAVAGYAYGRRHPPT